MRPLPGGRVALWALLWLGLAGCATTGAAGTKPGRDSGGVRGVVARAVTGAAPAEDDAFEQVLVLAGLEPGVGLPPREAPLTPEDAAALYARLLDRPVTLAGFGPRLVASHVLREVMEGERELERSVLLSLLERYRQLAVLRPDGYLAWALSGRTQQRVGPVEWRQGALRAGPFELGPFYSGERGAFRPVDARLQPWSGPPLAEVYDDADYLNRTLDGAEEAFVELAVAVGQLIAHPVASLEALRHLPAGLAALIASSPEYLARFRLMTRGEQVQAVSKLVSTLVATCGAAAGTTRTLASAARGAESLSVPALSLTVEGALAVERVAVPVGRAVTVLGGGPGAAIILQRASTAGGAGTPSPGPGQWGPARESMSRRAARYQEQISGRPVDQAYWVGGLDPRRGGVKFDGLKDGVLLEAKGPGYANKFLDNLTPKPWFEFSGAADLVKQARRQLAVSGGLPIRWHVAEKEAVGAIRALFKDNRVHGIEVVHTAALP